MISASYLVAHGAVLIDEGLRRAPAAPEAGQNPLFLLARDLVHVELAHDPGQGVHQGSGVVDLAGADAVEHLVRALGDPGRRPLAEPENTLGVVDADLADQGVQLLASGQGLGEGLAVALRVEGNRRPGGIRLRHGFRLPTVGNGGCSSSMFDAAGREKPVQTVCLERR